MKHFKWYILVLFVSASWQVFAQLTSLDELIKEKALNKHGTAKFSVLFWDIYQSHLWSSGEEYAQDNESHLLKIQYLRDIERDDLIEKTVEQWQHLNIPEKRYLPFVSTLKKLWPDINKGDSLALLKTKESSTFYYNDKEIGQIDDPYFSEIFLAIWLSPKTSQPKLREQLIKGKS